MSRKSFTTTSVSLFPTRLQKAQFRQGENGLEKSCAKCGQFWPATQEFFRLIEKRSGVFLDSWCKACWRVRGKEHGKRWNEERKVRRRFRSQPPPNTLSIREVAAAVGRSVDTVNLWCRKRLLSSVKSAKWGGWRIPADALATFTLPKPGGYRVRPPRPVVPKIDRRLRLVITTDEGPEIRCPRCGEFWPATQEFFEPRRNRLASWCRGCRREAEAARYRANRKPGSSLQITCKKTPAGVLVIVTYHSHTYAAVYPRDTVIRRSMVWRDLQEKGRGYGCARKFFRRYDPVTGKFVKYYRWPGLDAWKAARKLQRAELPKVDHAWAAYRRGLAGPPPPPDYFPSRWRSPRLQKLAAEIRTRAEARRNNPNKRKDGK